MYNWLSFREVEGPQLEFFYYAALWFLCRRCSSVFDFLLAITSASNLGGCREARKGIILSDVWMAQLMEKLDMFVKFEVFTYNERP